MEPEPKKRLVSIDQLKTLLAFMKQHPELARGLNRGRRGKLMTVKVWKKCAKLLNSIKDGANKDARGWSKYWCDWKYRVRRHALELKVAAETDSPAVLPEGFTPLSPVENTILSIIGGGDIDAVVVKTDPLAEESSNDEQPAGENDTNDEETRAGMKRRRSTIEATNDDEQDSDDSDAPLEQKARMDDAQGSVVQELDATAKFLQLEEKQLENSKRIEKSICRFSLELCKLNDIMAEIRDALIKRLDTVT